MSNSIVYKILLASEYRILEQDGYFCGTPADLKEGFIHLSTETQLENTIRKHYSKVIDAVIAAVDISVVKDIKWESASNGQMYPHIYGPLELSAVRDIRFIDAD